MNKPDAFKTEAIKRAILRGNPEVTSIETVESPQATALYIILDTMGQKACAMTTLEGEAEEILDVANTDIGRIKNRIEGLRQGKKHYGFLRSQLRRRIRLDMEVKEPVEFTPLSEMVYSLTNGREDGREALGDIWTMDALGAYGEALAEYKAREKEKIETA